MAERWGMRLGAGVLGQAVLPLRVWGHPVPQADQELCPPSCEVKGQQSWAPAWAGSALRRQGDLALPTASWLSCASTPGAQRSLQGCKQMLPCR